MFYLKANFCYTEPYRKKLDGICETYLFLGNNGQQMPVCSQDDFFLGIEDFKYVRHMYLGILQGTEACAASVAWVSLVSILLAGDWARVFTPVANCFSNTYHFYRLAPGSYVAYHQEPSK